MNKVLRLDFKIQPSSSFTSILWESPPSPLLIKHVKQKLKSIKVVDDSCHLRFQEEINGDLIWLDITNDEVPCPGENSHHVIVKVLKQCSVSSQTFLEDLFKGLHISPNKYSDVLNSVRMNLLNGIETKDEFSSDSEENEDVTDFIEPSSSNHHNNANAYQYQKFQGISNNTTTKQTSLNINDHVQFVDDDEFQDNEDNDDTFQYNSNTFKIDFGEETTQPDQTNMKKKKVSDEIDFLHGSGIPGDFPQEQKQNHNSLGELDDLMTMGNDFKAPTQSSTSHNNEFGGILDLDLGFESSKPSKSNTNANAHVKFDDVQRGERNEKLTYANEIDPMVKEWAKNSKTGTLKDIRSLLISLRSMLKKFGVEFENIMLSQIMSESSVKKMYFKVIRKIHPDKTHEKDPRLLYLFERLTEVINESYKKHKNIS